MSYESLSDDWLPYLDGFKPLPASILLQLTRCIAQIQPDRNSISSSALIELSQIYRKLGHSGAQRRVLNVAAQLFPEQDTFAQMMKQDKPRDRSNANGTSWNSTSELTTQRILSANNSNLVTRRGSDVQLEFNAENTQHTGSHTQRSPVRVPIQVTRLPLNSLTLLADEDPDAQSSRPAAKLLPSSVRAPRTTALTVRQSAEKELEKHSQSEMYNRMKLLRSSASKEHAHNEYSQQSGQQRNDIGREGENGQQNKFVSMKHLTLHRTPQSARQVVRQPSHASPVLQPLMPTNAGAQTQRDSSAYSNQKISSTGSRTERFKATRIAEDFPSSSDHDSILSTASSPPPITKHLLRLIRKSSANKTGETSNEAQEINSGSVLNVSLASVSLVSRATEADEKQPESSFLAAPSKSHTANSNTNTSSSPTDTVPDLLDFLQSLTLPTRRHSSPALFIKQIDLVTPAQFSLTYAALHQVFTTIIQNPAAVAAAVTELFGDVFKHSATLLCAHCTAQLNSLADFQVLLSDLFTLVGALRVDLSGLNSGSASHYASLNAVIKHCALKWFMPTLISAFNQKQKPAALGLLKQLGSMASLNTEDTSINTTSDLSSTSSLSSHCQLISFTYITSTRLILHCAVHQLQLDQSDALQLVVKFNELMDATHYDLINFLTEPQRNAFEPASLVATTSPIKLNLLKSGVGQTELSWSD